MDDLHFGIKNLIKKKPSLEKKHSYSIAIKTLHKPNHPSPWKPPNIQQMNYWQVTSKGMVVDKLVLVIAH